MNPLTNAKNLQKMNKLELEMGYAGKRGSWHDQYKNSAWIFVGGLPYDLTEGDVISVFSQYGEIANINLVRDKSSGKSKGFAFICYEDQRSTVLAVDNFNTIKICGRTIRVDHVADYKAPDTDKIEDEEVKDIVMRGCAPEVAVEREKVLVVKPEVKSDVRPKKDKHDDRSDQERRRERESSSSRKKHSKKEKRSTRSRSRSRSRDRRRDKHVDHRRRRTGTKMEEGGEERATGLPMVGSTFTRFTRSTIHHRKQELLDSPRPYKLECLATYTNCKYNVTCACDGWREISRNSENCRRCLHPKRAHYEHLSSLTDARLQQLLELYYDAETIFISLTKENDVETRKIFRYLYQILKKAVNEKSNAQLDVLKVLGQPPFEKPTFNALVQQFYNTKCIHFPAPERSSMMAAASGLIKSINCWRVDPHLIQPFIDNTTYIQWLCFCYVPLYCSSFNLHSIGDVFGTRFFTGVLPFFRSKLDEYVRSRSGPLPKQSQFVLEGFPKFMDLFEKDLKLAESSFWQGGPAAPLIESYSSEPPSAEIVASEEKEPPSVPEIQQALVKEEMEQSDEFAEEDIRPYAVVMTPEGIEKLVQDAWDIEQKVQGNVEVQYQLIHVPDDCVSLPEMQKVLLRQLVDIFSAQLPNLPQEFIVRTLFDYRQQTLTLVKNNAAQGGITCRMFPKFAEISLLAVSPDSQGNGFGGSLVSQCKDVFNEFGLMYVFVSCDEYSAGFFKLHGFSDDLSGIPKDLYTGYVMEYEGGTLMACHLDPQMLYSEMKNVLRLQMTALKQLWLKRNKELDVVEIDGSSLFTSTGVILNTSSIPGLRKVGYNPIAERCVTERELFGPDSDDDGSGPSKPKIMKLKLQRGRRTKMETKNDREAKFTQRYSWEKDFDTDTLHGILKNVLNQVKAHSAAWPFLKPVDRFDVPDYYEVIEHPMDLKTMTDRLKRGYYSHKNLFLIDMRRMLRNCRKYNNPETEYCLCADALQRFYISKMQEYGIDVVI